MLVLNTCAAPGHTIPLALDQQDKETEVKAEGGSCLECLERGEAVQMDIVKPWGPGDKVEVRHQQGSLSRSCSLQPSPACPAQPKWALA